MGYNEEPITEAREYTLKTMLLTMFIICTGALACSAGTFLVLDNVCTGNARAWIPVYPNSTVVSEAYTFMRPFGVGVTGTVLTTEDNANTVRRWYNEQRGKNEPNPTNLLATMRYNIGESEDGTGTTIVLNSECAWK